MPRQLGDPMPEAWVTLEDGTETKAFDSYPDEITITAEELIGRTLEECRALKHARDRAYLQS